MKMTREHLLGRVLRRSHYASSSGDDRFELVTEELNPSCRHVRCGTVVSNLLIIPLPDDARWETKQQERPIARQQSMPS